MIHYLQTHLAAILDRDIKKIVPLSGGDIAQAYLVYTSSDRLFCKILTGPDSTKMIQAEREGLQAIAQTNTIKVPEVLGWGSLEKGDCLLLEYIEPGRATTDAMEKLGYDLARMHSISQDEFGWHTTNFIGSLPQTNKKTQQWTSFYLKERLLPQLVLARKKNLLSGKDIPDEKEMMEKLQQYIPDALPSLVHGDLWGGNYLISSQHIPYLIDPAVYIGHHEVDLAMSRLFGGFDQAFYKAYHEIIPQAEGYGHRMGLYQLYYLLVHLNLFGKTYYKSVKNLVSDYF